MLGHAKNANNVSKSMDLSVIKEAIVKNVYHIPSDKKVPLHKHDDKD